MKKNKQNNRIPLTLEQHQQILYDILYMVDDFCKAHDIPYFLVGGTLLGAVRHQGIIPWDDDVDIAMTRENYERFNREFRAEKVDGYELYDYEHSRNYFHPFLKLARTDTWTNSKVTHSIAIDIFAYDGCGDNLQQAQQYFLHLQEETRTVIKKLWLAYAKGINKVKFFIKYFPIIMIYYLPLKCITPMRLRYLHGVYGQFCKFNVADCKYAANIPWGRYGIGEVQPSESFIKLTTMQFGERALPVPSGWHDYLTGIYGDYMVPLPLEKRHRHTKISYRVVFPREVDGSEIE